MAEPGWYNDDQDAALARWHDGGGWTDHTLVKADWHGPGAPPPPLQPAFPPAPPHQPWMRDDGAVPPFDLATLSYRSRMGERYRSAPLWARIAGPAVVGLIVIGAAAGGDDEDGSGVITESPTATIVVPMSEAVDIASSYVDGQVSDAALRGLIRDLCDADVDEGAATALSITREPSALRQVIDGAGRGAAAYCPEFDDARPSIVTDVQAAAAEATFESSTTTSVVEATTTTVRASDVPPSTTATTRPRPTATTAPPVAPLPVVPPPVVTTAPAPQQQCHPSYSGCLNPNSPDYDCAGGQGNGPDYTGPVSVYGSDPFDLDRDNDGLGCEDG